MPVHEIHQDLIGAPAGAVGERLEGEVEHLNRSREEALVSQLEEAIGSEAGAALGPDEVLQALEEGRARHVIFAADGRDAGPERKELSERLIELAIATSAEITPVEGFAAEALNKREGVAALLRY
jgi:stalled ribosome rescue protein Dom34